MFNLETLVENYGYFLIFFILILGIVGLPFPDEVLLTYVGYNVFLGKMSLFYAILIAIIGSIIGISISYLLGHKLGIPFIKRFGPKVKITEKNINWTQKRFKKYGGFFLLSGYFIPGVRHITAYIAGISSYRFSYFAIFAYIGAIIWASLFILLGNFLGASWGIIEQLSPFMSKMFLILLLIGMVYFLLKKRTQNENYNK